MVRPSVPAGVVARSRLHMCCLVRRLANVYEGGRPAPISAFWTTSGPSASLRRLGNGHARGQSGRQAAPGGFRGGTPPRRPLKSCRDRLVARVGHRPTQGAAREGTTTEEVLEARAPRSPCPTGAGRVLSQLLRRERVNVVDAFLFVRELGEVLPAAVFAFLEGGRPGQGRRRRRCWWRSAARYRVSGRVEQV